MEELNPREKQAYLQLGIDSQCLSYIIEAMSSTCLTQEEVAEQQLALIRLFFYLPETLWVTPTVTSECARIRNTDRATLHKSFIATLFGEIPLKKPNEAKSRANFFQTYHKGKNDCLVLAEAEDVGHKVLLSYDSDFLKHLSKVSKTVTILKPTEYWTSLSIPHGSLPDKVPHLTNPLANQKWWIW